MRELFMKQWLNDLNRRFQRWMIGRYGTDELSRFLNYLGLVFLILSFFKPLRNLYVIAWIAIIYSYYRCFSKNIIRRSKERDIYMRYSGKVASWIQLRKRIFKERSTHRYFRCPKCRTMIRVPKGKGKIVITCTRCRNEIIKTT